MPDGRERHERRLWLSAAAALALAASAAILVVGRDVTFFLDDWYFIGGRRGISAATLLEPHNGHFSVLLVITYKVLLATAGMDDVWVFKLALVTVHAAVVMLLFLVARRHTAPVLAFLLVAPLALMGAGWSDLLSPFQISFLGSLACGLGALLAVDSAGRARQALTAVLLLASLAWSGIGLLFLVAVALYALQTRGPRWAAETLAAPVGVYVAWYSVYHEDPSSHGVSDALRSVWNGVPHAIASYTGGGDGLGRVVAVGCVYILVLFGLRHRRLPAITVAGLAGALAFFALTGYARGAESYAESRYQTPACVLLVCAAAGMLPQRVPDARILLPAAAAVVVALVSGWSDFTGGRDLLVASDRPVLARLRAVEVGRRWASPDLQPDPVRLGSFTMRQYLAMVDSFGSPAPSLQQIRASDPATKGEFDNALLAAEGLRVTPVARVPSGCRPVSLRNGAVLVKAGGAFVIRAADNEPASVGMRRLAPDGIEQQVAVIPPRSALRVETRSDTLPEPWTVRAYAARSVDLCA